MVLLEVELLNISLEEQKILLKIDFTQQLENLL